MLHAENPEAYRENPELDLLPHVDSDGPHKYNQGKT